MSREFGSYEAGWFHYQMQIAAEDCLSSEKEITRLWGRFLEEFSAVAYSIASYEAGDSGADDPIFKTIKKMDYLKARLSDIEDYCDVFKRIAENSIRDYIENNESAKKSEEGKL